MPRATAQVSTPIAGTSWWASIAPPRPSAAATSPGHRRAVRSSRWPRRGPTTSSSAARTAPSLWTHGHAGTSCVRGARIRAGRPARHRAPAGDQLDRLRPVAEPGGRVEVADRAERVRPAAPGVARAAHPHRVAQRVVGAGRQDAREGQRPARDRQPAVRRGAPRSRGTPGAAAGEGRRRRQQRADDPRRAVLRAPSARSPGRRRCGRRGPPDRRRPGRSGPAASPGPAGSRLVRPSGGTVRAPGSVAASRASASGPRRGRGGPGRGRRSRPRHRVAS